MAGSKRAAPEEELRSYLIEQRIPLQHLTNFCMLLAMWASKVSKTLTMTDRSSNCQTGDHRPLETSVFGQEMGTDKLSEAQIVHIFSAWDPDGNISSSELEQSEPDEQGDGAMSYVNDDCDDDIQLSKSRKGGEILELHKVS
jgi:hypothetical protein